MVDLTTKVISANTKTCPLHGEYEERVTKIGAREIVSQCEGCLEDAKENERREEQEARFLERLQTVHIPPRFMGLKIRDYVSKTQAQKDVVRKLVDYVKGFVEVRETGRSLILIGDVGTGKTMLACALLSAVCGKGYSCRYTTIAGMVREIRATWGDALKSEEEAIQRFVDRDLLVIDELGVQSGSENEQGLVFEVIDQRYQQRRPTVVCGNVSNEELVKCLGERSVDRLREGGGELLAFTWESYRRSA